MPQGLKLQGTLPALLSVLLLPADCSLVVHCALIYPIGTRLKRRPFEAKLLLRHEIPPCIVSPILCAVRLLHGAGKIMQSAIHAQRSGLRASRVLARRQAQLACSACPTKKNWSSVFKRLAADSRRCALVGCFSRMVFGVLGWVSHWGGCVQLSFGAQGSSSSNARLAGWGSSTVAGRRSLLSSPAHRQFFFLSFQRSPLLHFCGGSSGWAE
jgi:hypothetical protein